MNNKILALILACLILGVVAFFVFRPNVAVAPELSKIQTTSSTNSVNSVNSVNSIVTFSSSVIVSSSSINLNKLVTNGDNISVNYVGKFQDGKVFDTSLETVAKSSGIYNPSRPYSPLAFIVGNGDMIKGFDEAVIGMKIGETKTITLPPEKAYGNSNPDLIKTFALSQFQQAGLTPKLGDEIPVGAGVNCKIIFVDEKEAKMDCNSPMAGKTLVFDITLVSIN